MCGGPRADHGQLARGGLVLSHSNHAQADGSQAVPPTDQPTSGSQAAATAAGAEAAPEQEGGGDGEGEIDEEDEGEEDVVIK